MPTNEELVLEIQKGNHDKIAELWSQVESYVRSVAVPILRAIEDNPVYDIDDLMQAGYLALEKAVCDFECDRGYKFTTYFWYVLKRSFAEATGFRSKTQKMDPINSAVSLDAPLINNHNDDFQLSDIIPEPLNPIEQFEESEYEN